MHPLRKLRIEHGLTQAELAAKVGCSESFISQIERGVAKGGYDTVIALANYFHVAPTLIRPNDDSLSEPASSRAVP